MYPPISQLPVETLQQVFEELSKNHLLELRHALLTCKLWFRAITSYQGLWATIEVNEPFVAYFFSRPSAQEVSFLESCIARSGCLPLRLRLSITDLFRVRDDYDPYLRLWESLNRLDDIISAMLGEGINTLDRYQSMDIVCDHHYSDDVLACVKGFTFHMKNLRQLTFREYGPSQQDHQFIQSCGNLDEMHLQECYFGKSGATRAFTISICQSVKKLVVERLFDWDLSTPCLSEFHGVEYLALISARPKWIRDTDYNGSGEPSGSISLPALQTLELIGIVPFPVLDQLRLPRLVELRIGCDEPGYHSMPIVLQTDFCKQIKSLVIYPDSSDLHVHLPEFLERASNLHSLTLPRQWKDNPDARIELSRPLDLVFV